MQCISSTNEGGGERSKRQRGGTSSLKNEFAEKVKEYGNGPFFWDGVPRGQIWAS